MKFSGQHNAKKKETPFLKDRLTALQEWTSTLLQNVGPTGVDEVDCLDTFFQAFSPGNNPSAGNCDMRRSMFHLLKSVRISTNVYNQLCKRTRNACTHSCTGAHGREIFPAHAQS